MVLRCWDCSCPAGVTAHGYEKALSSEDPVVKARAQEVQRMIKLGVGGASTTAMVVSAVALKHADHCRSPPALEVTHLAENPLVQRIVREAHSHDTVKEMVRGMTGVYSSRHPT